MNTIDHPPVRTYWITFVWLARLAEYGIIPEIDEQENLVL